MVAGYFAVQVEVVECHEFKPKLIEFVVKLLLANILLIFVEIFYKSTKPLSHTAVVFGPRRAVHKTEIIGVRPFPRIVDVSIAKAPERAKVSKFCIGFHSFVNGNNLNFVGIAEVGLHIVAYFDAEFFCQFAADDHLLRIDEPGSVALYKLESKYVKEAFGTLRVRHFNLVVNALPFHIHIGIPPTNAAVFFHRRNLATDVFQERTHIVVGQLSAVQRIAALVDVLVLRDALIEGQLEIGYRRQHVERGDGDGDSDDVQERRHRQQLSYLKVFHSVSNIN